MNTVTKGFINSKEFNDAVSKVRAKDYSEIKKGIQDASNNALELLKKIKVTV